MKNETTPLSNGVFPSEREIDVALSVNRRYNLLEQDLEALARDLKIEFQYLSVWPDSHGVYFKWRDVPHIWIPRSVPFFEFVTFCHEYHHATFAPDICLGRKQNVVLTARYEGKASAFAAIAAMPLLEYKHEEDIYRAFGEPFRHCAHYRILHFKKYGW